MSKRPFDGPAIQGSHESNTFAGPHAHRAGLPQFQIARSSSERAAVTQARSGVAGRVGFSKAHPVAAASVNRRARLSSRPTPANRGALLPVFFWAPVIAHALGWAVAGTWNPADWPRLLVLATMLFIAPLIAFALIALRAILDGRGG